MAVVFHVEPRDLEIEIEYSEHFAPDGESCADKGVPQSTSRAVAPTWVTLIACSAGEGYVRLVASDTDHVISETGVRVEDPSTRSIRQTVRRPSMSLTGVPSSLTIGRGSGSFSVQISGLDSSETYELHAVSLNLRLAFNSGCTNHNKSNTFSPTESRYSRSYNLWGCRTPGGYVWAYMDAENGGSYATELTDHYVTVVEAPTPPTPAPEPPPVSFTAPSNFRYEPSSATAGQATFRWTAAQGADKHIIEKKVERLIIPDRWEQVGSDLGSNASQVTLSGISVDGSQLYRVTAVKGTDKRHSAEVEVRLKQIPQNLRAGHAGHGRAKLTWDPVDSAQSYVIQRRNRVIPTERYADWPTKDIESGPVLDATTGKITAVVKNLPPGEESRFKVKAMSVHGLSEGSIPSNTLRVTDDRPSGPPTGEEWYKTPGFRSIILEWNDDSSGHTGYLVESTPASALVDSTKIYNHGSDKKRLHIDGLPYNERYTFKIYAVNATPVEVVKSEDFADLTFTIPEPSLWWGHQADHNVKYTLGAIGNSIIQNAISPAVVDWNARLPEVVGKGLAICPAPGLACNDSFTVTIKTVDNKNDSTTATLDPNEGCGPPRACMKRVGDGGESAGPGRHMENMFMVFEDPPWFAVRDKHGDWHHTEYVWTDDRNVNGDKVPCTELMAICDRLPTRYYVYVGRVMLHEFGHTLGLPDFYVDTTGLSTLKAIMNMSFVIEDQDIAQLEAIYLLHSAH